MKKERKPFRVGMALMVLFCLPNMRSCVPKDGDKLVTTGEVPCMRYPGSDSDIEAPKGQYTIETIPEGTTVTVRQTEGQRGETFGATSHLGRYTRVETPGSRFDEEVGGGNTCWVKTESLSEP